ALFYSSSLTPPLPPHHLHSFPTRRSSDLQHLLDSFATKPTGSQSDQHYCAIYTRFDKSAQAKLAPDCRSVRSDWRVQSYQSPFRSEEHTSELQSRFDLVCRLLLAKKKKTE